jgi:hypothetical protein
MPSNNNPKPVEAVLAALAERPGATAAEIAEAAGIGRSTATKALATLSTSGQAERADGGREAGRRLPDRWSLTMPKTPAGRGVAADSAAAPSVDRGDRLGRGKLAALVLGYLRDNPGEHSPTAIAKALGGKSSGATGNALERFVTDGTAVPTSDAPRRYARAT